MSCDITVVGPESESPCRCSECGNEHSRPLREQFFEASHAVSYDILRAAGLTAFDRQTARERPEPVAGVVENLAATVAELKARPDKYKPFGHPKGFFYGDYFSTVAFLESLLAACREHPDAWIYT